MNMKYPYDSLMIGVISSLFMGILILLFQSLIAQNFPIKLWLLIITDVLLLLQKSEFDKLEDQGKLTWVEPFFLIANLIIVLFALSGFLITFSQYWFAKEIRYASLAFGLPSICALSYWRLSKYRKTIN